ncbi:hypothetical protein KIPB_012555, partial [Kipferlia bialata]|eukprot:g12555.t1
MEAPTVGDVGTAYHTLCRSYPVALSNSAPCLSATEARQVVPKLHSLVSTMLQCLAPFAPPETEASPLLGGQSGLGQVLAEGVFPSLFPPITSSDVTGTESISGTPSLPTASNAVSSQSAKSTGLYGNKVLAGDADMAFGSGWDMGGGYSNYMPALPTTPSPSLRQALLLVLDSGDIPRDLYPVHMRGVVQSALGLLSMTARQGLVEGVHGCMPVVQLTSLRGGLESAMHRAEDVK